MKFIFLLLSLIPGVALLAENNIPLSYHRKDGKEWPVKRTPPIIPTLEYDGNVFTVTTPLTTECVPLSIYSEDGTMVYSFTNCEPARSHSFTVTALIPGDTYTVEVTIGSITWTGDFTWEND